MGLLPWRIWVIRAESKYPPAKPGGLPVLLVIHWRTEWEGERLERTG